MPDDAATTTVARAVREARDVTGHDATSQARLSRSPSAISWKLALVVIWLSFSLALAVWWLIFGLMQIDRLSALTVQEPGSVIATRLTEELVRHHRMLMSEGVTLCLLLLAGGAALIYYIRLELGRARRIQEFFAAFTHDLKTSLSSLRLQAESLEEDLKDSGESRIARRLVKDTVRLELQLENSLLLAAPSSEARLLFEPIHLGEVLNALSQQWNDLDFAIEGDAEVWADRRAVESIFKNLLQNAVIHGRANKITIDIQREGPWVTTRLSDDGRGFKGDFSRLGRMFERHSTTSGSGLGLSLAQGLAKSMRGDLRFVENSAGFTVDLLLPLSEVGAGTEKEIANR